MTDVPGVARSPVEQRPTAHHATTDAGGHDHGDEVTDTGGRPRPSFAQGEGLGIVVEHHAKTGRLGQTVPQRETAPRRNVEGGNGAGVAVHGPPAPQPAHHGLVLAPGARRFGTDLLHQARQGGEEHLRIGRARRRNPPRGEDLALSSHQAGGELGAAYIDGQARGHGAPPPGHGAREPGTSMAVGPR
jgi:hypothetical protein